MCDNTVPEEPKIKLYSEGKNYTLYQGSMLDMLDVIEPNSIDSVEVQARQLCMRTEITARIISISE